MIGRNLSELVRETRTRTGDVEERLLSDAAVRDAILQFAPAALSQWRETLVAELRDEIARAQVAARPSAESTAAAEGGSSSGSSISGSNDRDTEDEEAAPPPPPAPDPDLISERHMFEHQVSSRWQSKRHLVAIGPPLADHTRWLTRCGWRFGVQGYAIRPDPAHPLCTKCARANGG